MKKETDVYYCCNNIVWVLKIHQSQSLSSLSPPFFLVDEQGVKDFQMCKIAFTFSFVVSLRSTRRNSASNKITQGKKDDELAAPSTSCTPRSPSLSVLPSQLVFCSLPAPQPRCYSLPFLSPLHPLAESPIEATLMSPTSTMLRFVLENRATRTFEMDTGAHQVHLISGNPSHRQEQAPYPPSPSPVPAPQP
jgi:hypothetical protein